MKKNGFNSPAVTLTKNVTTPTHRAAKEEGQHCDSLIHDGTRARAGVWIESVGRKGAPPQYPGPLPGVSSQAPFSPGYSPAARPATSITPSAGMSQKTAEFLTLRQTPVANRG